MRTFIFFVVVMASLAACTHKNLEGGQPALLVSQDKASFAEISSRINSVVGHEVRLAKSIFTQNSLLALEKPDMTGRVLDMPKRFQLLLKNDRCFLHYLDENKGWLLKKAECQAAAK